MSLVCLCEQMTMKRKSVMTMFSYLTNLYLVKER
ncbi:hypothetical protein VCHA43P277_110156 [Vibrio chagasii]|nr:hypothetical protein VCHA34P112_110119 [Vibrio chagasii]CAH6808442.1 hypothetical protein VCHA35O143_120112 [Vibrio chagasii]CAH6828182.1 hypothetical protein VCHA34P126_160077 [Vibrio chagasii]CAH6889462.1 hypothetical protein VCHA40O231_100022 [Vibrio chagasii]CAH6907145.1 hypothetical protein VCHA43P277_110156 [Vibrio chagasii]